MKKRAISRVKKIASVVFLLLLVSIFILPLSLFHQHSSQNSVNCSGGICEVNHNSLVETGIAFKSITNPNTVEDCLFCTWQMGAKPVYIITYFEAFLPDFTNLSQTDCFSFGKDFLAVINISNRGPPAFLIF